MSVYNCSMFTVYVIKSGSSGKIYIGQTNDLSKRIYEHNDPDYRLTKYTKRNRGPWVIVYSENYNCRIDALRREKQLKSAKGREFIHNLIKKL